MADVRSDARRWAKRCHEYDRCLDELQRAEQIRERREMRRRQIEIGMELQGVAEQQIAKLQQRIDKGLPLSLTAAQIVRLIEVGAKLERTARGEERESQFTKIEVIVADALPDEPEQGQN